MDAMEQSNLMLAKILDLAMQHGIAHWELSFSQLDLGEEFETFFYPCIDWLEAEGLIRVGERAQEMGGLARGVVMNISLTSRGMAVLGHKINVNGTEEALSDTVKKVSQGKVDYHKIGDAIGGIIGGIIKSVSS